MAACTTLGMSFFGSWERLPVSHAAFDMGAGKRAVVRESIPAYEGKWTTLANGRIRPATDTQRLPIGACQAKGRADVGGVKKKPSKRSIKERIKQLDAEIAALDEKIFYHYSVGNFKIRDREMLIDARTVLRLQLEGYFA